MTIRNIVIAGLAVIGLSACAPVNHQFGEAVAWNKAIQTENPDPVYPEDGAQPGDNAEVAADAAEAHREGRVERRTVSTGSGGGASGGSGVGAGSGGGTPR